MRDIKADLEIIQELRKFIPFNIRKYYSPLTGLDICGLDKSLLEKYSKSYPEGTSMKEFVAKQFGDQAVNLIIKLF